MPDDTQPRGDSIRTRRGLARHIKHFNGLQHPADEAYRWAIDTLIEAGYPTEAGQYRIKDHCLEPLSPNEEVSGWEGRLAGGVLKLGHERGSDVHRAAELIDMFSKAQHCIDENNSRTAMRVGIRIGQLWEARLRDSDAKAGRKLRLGGRPEATAAADQERHGLWFEADLKLRQEHPELSARGRAKEIGKAFSVSEETVRSELRKMRPPKK